MSRAKLLITFLYVSISSTPGDQITFAQVPNDYELLDVSISDQEYTAISLTPGAMYKFKVQARNAFGLSDYSLEVFILAAEEPGQVAAPLTTFNRDSVSIDWTEPFTGGSPITAYQIYILESD